MTSNKKGALFEDLLLNKFFIASSEIKALLFLKKKPDNGNTFF